MSKLEIVPLNLGQATANVRLDVFWGLYNQDETVPIPTGGFLIRGGNENIVVDAGTRYFISSEWTMEQQLKNNGLEMGDITKVILTHLHFDHVGQCELFKNAEFIIQRKELEAAAAPKSRHMKMVDEYSHDLWYQRRDVAMFVDTLWSRVELIEGEEEIIPGVRCVPFFNSHSPGSQAVYVDLGGKTAAIAGDLCRNIKLNIEYQLPPAIYYDLEAMQTALWRLKREADIILPAHDLAVYEMGIIK